MPPKSERIGVSKRKVFSRKKNPAALPAESRLERALFQCSMASEEAVDKMRAASATDFNEHGATAIRPAYGGRAEDEMKLFHCFVLMGLVPPFSDFFMAVLEVYGLQALQLHPNAVLTLAIFAYTCEAFVGVMPSVALFRHFFVPRIGRSRWIAGGITFRLREECTIRYPAMNLKPRWGEWRNCWAYVRVGKLHACLMAPEAPAEHLANSKAVSPQDHQFSSTVLRFFQLKNSGLTVMDSSPINIPEVYFPHQSVLKPLNPLMN